MIKNNIFSLDDGRRFNDDNVTIVVKCMYVYVENVIWAHNLLLYSSNTPLVTINGYH